MGLTAVRPFKSQDGRTSALNILNQNDYVICGKQWVAEDDVNGVYNEGCAKLVVDLPVPVIEEEEEDDVVDNTTGDDDKEDSKSGASSLATSALAAMALYALT